MAKITELLTDAKATNARRVLFSLFGKL